MKEAGSCKDYAYIPKIQSGWGRDNNNQPEETYNYNVIHDDGTDHPVLKPDNRQSTWVEMGSYHFSSDSARIELTNNTKARSIYADAVKLIKEK